MKNQKQKSFSKDSIPSSVEWNQDKEKKLNIIYFVVQFKYLFAQILHDHSQYFINW